MIIFIMLLSSNDDIQSSTVITNQSPAQWRRKGGARALPTLKMEGQSPSKNKSVYARNTLI